MNDFGEVTESKSFIKAARACDSIERGRGLKIVLTILCSLLSVGAMFNISRLLLDASMIFDGQVASDKAIRYLGVVASSGILDVALLVVFISFTLSVVRCGNIFSKAQSLRLLVIGIILLVEMLLDLFMPIFLPPSAEMLSIDPSAVSPTLDLRLLSFSFVFFALSGIFEYGRMLQEDVRITSSE